VRSIPSWHSQPYVAVAARAFAHAGGIVKARETPELFVQRAPEVAAQAARLGDHAVHDAVGQEVGGADALASGSTAAAGQAPEIGRLVLQAYTQASGPCASPPPSISWTACCHGIGKVVVWISV